MRSNDNIERLLSSFGKYCGSLQDEISSKLFEDCLLPSLCFPTNKRYRELKRPLDLDDNSLDLTQGIDAPTGRVISPKVTGPTLPEPSENIFSIIANSLPFTTEESLSTFLTGDIVGT